MEFHLFLPQMRLSPDALVERARTAETAGFTGLAVMDHLFPPGAADQPMYEALTTVTWLAAATDRLLLGHLVLCDSFRHPSVLARQAVTLDHLSGGRFELGIGSGSTPGELATFGFGAPTPAERLERLAETLSLVTRFWTGEPVDHHGTHFRVQGARQLPVPLGTIPIVVGGTGPSTMALVAEYADWWNVPMHQTHRLASARRRAVAARVSVQLLVTLVTDEHRRNDVVTLAQRRFGGMSQDGHLVGSPDELLPRLAALEADGVERVYVWFTDFAAPETLDAFGREVIGALA
jgi:alkanesulfonate monooxygenase SsuD/methylene tetrahydromethanopterin reductase-like flavin-dependent oxidoreductase (luciferase family)